MNTPLASLLGLSLALALSGIAGPTNENTKASVQNLHTRQFKVSTDTLMRNVRKLLPPKAGESNHDLLVRFFKEKKVDIQKPATLSLDEKKGVLLVRTSLGDLDKIEDLVAQTTSKK